MAITCVSIPLLQSSPTRPNSKHWKHWKASSNGCGFLASSSSRPISFHQIARQSSAQPSQSRQLEVCCITGGSAATIRHCSSKSTFTKTNVVKTSSPMKFWWAFSILVHGVPTSRSNPNVKSSEFLYSVPRYTSSDGWKLNRRFLIWVMTKLQVYGQQSNLSVNSRKFLSSLIEYSSLAQGLETS